MAGLSNSSMSLKAYQKPKHSIAVYNTMRNNCTALDRFDTEYHFMLFVNNERVNRLFM